MKIPRNEPIYLCVDDLESEFRSAHVEAIEYLDASSQYKSSDSNSVTARFNFPKDVSVVCEQYLLYFAQFLSDIGVDVATRLDHEAGDVLFTVTPVDQTEALGKIRVALDIYLRMAANPVAGLSATTTIQERMLTSEIMSFQSKLLAAQAIIEAKNETILALRERLDVREIAPSPAITPDLFVASVKQITETQKDKDKEDLLGGVVQLGTVDLPGGKISVAEAYRWARRTFTKKKKHES